MNIKEFLDKWDDKVDESFRHEFISDVYSTVTSNAYQSVAVDILGSIEGAELILTTTSQPYNGIVAFGKKGESIFTGTIVSYSPAVGIQESDWRYLLETIVKQSLK